MLETTVRCGGASFTPRTAADGSAGLATFRANPADYALVLLALLMPGLSGEQVCERIRQDSNLTGLKVIAYTAHAMPEEKSRIMGAGFDDLLIKPIARAGLLAALGLG